MEKMGRNMDGLYAWRKENIKRMVIDLNKVTDADIIKWLETMPNKREYILKLIRDDMDRNQ